MSPGSQHGRFAASPAKTNTNSIRKQKSNAAQRTTVPSTKHKRRPASYLERVNAGLEVVGDGMHLQ